MSANVPAAGNPMPDGGTVWGAASVRKALDRFRTLLDLAIAATVLIVLEDYLTKLEVIPGTVPSGPLSYAEWWTVTLPISLAIVLGLAIAALVIAAIVVAVMGAGAWRRGVLAMVQGSPELGAAQAESAQRARRDHARTLWLFLGFIVVAIVLAIAFAVTNFALTHANLRELPGVVQSVASSLGSGAVLVGIYYYGGRHLAGLLETISSEAGRLELRLGRQLLLAGSLVGLAGAFAPLAWPMSIAGVVSLIVIRLGAGYLHDGYVRWLAGGRPGSGLPTARATAG